MQKRPQSPRPPKAEVSEQAGRGADAAARRPSRPNDFPVLEPLLPLISARIIKASPEELDEMNDPALQSDPEKSQEIAAAYAAKEQEIATRYDRWAQITEA